MQETYKITDAVAGSKNSYLAEQFFIYLKQSAEEYERMKESVCEEFWEGVIDPSRVIRKMDAK